MSSPRHHNTVRTLRLHRLTGSAYGVVTGTVLNYGDRLISGRGGDHLQFAVQIGPFQRYVIDANVKSRDGTNIEVCFADEDMSDSIQRPDFGFSSHGSLSYREIGLTDNSFRQVSEGWIINKLEAELHCAEFVEIYGTTFHDGRLDGVHYLHFNPKHSNQDGAIAIYDTQRENPVRTWVFFKFANDSIEN
jgi:hypothetical protein